MPAKKDKKSVEETNKKVEEAKLNAKLAEEEHNEKVFKELGYLIHSDLKYDGVLYPADTRLKLENLDEKELVKLMAKGIISK